MFDRDLIEKLPKADKDNLIAALSTVAQSPIIELQLSRLMSQLEAGAEDEADEAVVVKVKTYRRESRRIFALRDLGLLLLKD